MMKGERGDQLRVGWKEGGKEIHLLEGEVTGPGRAGSRVKLTAPLL